MNAFSIGLIIGGLIGIPFAVWIAGRRKKKEDGDGSEESSV